MLGERKGRKSTVNEEQILEKSIKCAERRIRRKLHYHLRKLGISEKATPNNSPPIEKEDIRGYHALQRRDRLKNSKVFISKKLPSLIQYFADGEEVNPERITPTIEVVKSGTKEADLFRLACLTWSIPVSEGYGRRMRFLVWDKNNEKIIGIIAIGDPVFNIKARDAIIGWTASDRKERLINVMDAYVLGALAPYNFLLGGKLVACLVRTREIRDTFRVRYGKSEGIISGKKKAPRLVLVTTSSALGRSSVYNRLTLDGTKYFESVGYTSGFGHFHIPDDLFKEMRDYLKLRGHDYADGNRYGNGPNWKFRTIRTALEQIGIKRDILNHGIKREVFFSRLAVNADKILLDNVKIPDYSDLLSVAEVGELAIERWIIPRAERRPGFAQWKKSDMKKLL